MKKSHEDYDSREAESKEEKRVDQRGELGYKDLDASNSVRNQLPLIFTTIIIISIVCIILLYRIM